MDVYRYVRAFTGTTRDVSRFMLEIRALHDWSILNSTRHDVIIDIFKHDTIFKYAENLMLASDLNFHEFILHLILVKVVLPYKESYEFITPSQMFYIYGLKHKIPLDFVKAILFHMNKSVYDHSLVLPYGQLITHLLFRLDYDITNPSFSSSSKVFDRSDLKFYNIIWCPTALGWSWNGVIQTYLNDTSLLSHSFKNTISSYSTIPSSIRKF